MTFCILFKLFGFFDFIWGLALTIELPQLSRMIWVRFFLIRHFEQNFLLITGHFSSFCETSLKRHRQTVQSE